MQRWEACRERFRAIGVRLVAISADTVAEAARMRERHGFEMTLLSDESLSVIDLYHLRHERNVTPTRGLIRPLAVPATILIGTDGVVKWIDRSSDFRTRSSPDHVLAAVGDALADHL